jgi:hypothetical protein
MPESLQGRDKVDWQRLIRHCQLSRPEWLVKRRKSKNIGFG